MLSWSCRFGASSQSKLDTVVNNMRDLLVGKGGERSEGQEDGDHEGDQEAAGPEGGPLQEAKTSESGLRQGEKEKTSDFAGSSQEY